MPRTFDIHIPYRCLWLSSEVDRLTSYGGFLVLQNNFLGGAERCKDVAQGFYAVMRAYFEGTARNRKSKFTM